MLTSADKLDYLNAARGWSVNKSVGICGNNSYLTSSLPNTDKLRSWLESLMLYVIKDLGYYSGDDTYPIDPSYGHSGNIYIACYANRSLWDISSTYGARRKQVWETMLNLIEDGLQEYISAIRNSTELYNAK